MKVYIVAADLWSVADLIEKDDSLDLCDYNARENRAVFSTREKAEEFKKDMEETIREEAEENGFTPMEYVIEEWEIDGGMED